MDSPWSFASALGAYGLVALFGVMLLKEIGVPIPVPSDLLMITAGVQAATGAYSLLELAIILEVAILIGGSVQFLVSRGAGRRFIYRFGRFVGLSPKRLDLAGEKVQRRGATAVFVGLNLPAARAGIVVAAGLAGLSYPSFVPAMLLGSTIFYGWHIALGFIAGPAATQILDGLSVPLVPLIIGLALLGLAVWLVLRARRKEDPADGAMDHLHSWTEAACPVCLAWSAAERLRQPA